MKVALVIEALDPARGGVEQWTWQFASRLGADGHEVHVVTSRAAAATAQLPWVIHTVRAGGSRLRWADDCAQVLRGLAVDVIHDTGCGWYCDVFQPHGGSRIASFERNQALAAPWLRPVRRQVTSWLPRYREFSQLAARQYHDDGRLFLALSWMVAGDLVRDYHVAPERVRLVYNGVDVERFSPEHRPRFRQAVRTHLGVGEDEVLLLVVAHNFRLKGVPSLLRATARLRAAGYPVRLVVAGGDKSQRRYATWARRHDLGATVNWAGAVVDPVPLYAAADVYVQPTFYDPCSLVVLEALASGLPVVTTRFNGAGELIQRGHEGQVIDDPANDLELAQALEPCFDATTRQAMGQAARRLALEHDWERNYREILAVYHELAGARRRAA